MNKNRFNKIKNKLNADRDNIVVKTLREAPDLALNETGRAVKYAYELLDWISWTNEERMQPLVTNSTPQEVAPSGLHGAACCASDFERIVDTTSSITGIGKDIVRNSLVSIAKAYERGSSQRGVMQEKLVSLLNQDNPEILEELKSLPVESCYRRQSTLPNQVRP